LKQLTFWANIGIYIGEGQYSVSESENISVLTISPATTFFSE